MTLPDQILSLDPPESLCDYADRQHEAVREAYVKGFRDARDAAAEIARATLSAPAEWQPIETAPKDGRHMLLCDGARVSFGGWLTDIDQGAEYEGQIGMAGWWAVDLGPNIYRPTHWMPLPAAPQPQEQT